MNRLEKSTSPYLRQHAHNPVDWYPWGAEAHEKARREDKPILVSIGYSSCHWCHVMEEESFMDEDVASFMNQHFVNIKVDREERPDVDQVYMDAVQILTGRGGWPLNCFLTPELKPFYGGTYFPPQPRHGMLSWMQLLQRISQAYREDRGQVDRQADQLTGAIQGQRSHLVQKVGNSYAHRDERESLTEWYYELAKQFDRQFGGFGQAPKFPMITTLQLLLRIYYHTGKKEALEQVQRTLRAMLRGGIYDLVGGGLARYATDRAWKVPHFEKMLYDNAQLMELLADVYQLDGNETWAFFIRDIHQFLQQEMHRSSGGYYSALDADSEGIEGKYYTWSWSELESLLIQPEWIWLKDHFDLNVQGNWEHTNILYLQEAVDVERLLDKDSPWPGIRAKLKAARDHRIRPLLDDKISTHWNGLVIKALYHAGYVLGDQQFIDDADESLHFFLDHHRHAGQLAHIFAGGWWQEEVFLDDYAGIIAALVERIQLAGGTEYLHQVQVLTQEMIRQFYQPDSTDWVMVPKTSGELPVEVKPMYDYVYPSATSSAASSLLRLGNMMDGPDWLAIAVKTMQSLEPLIHGYLSGFVSGAVNMTEIWFGINQLAIIGPRAPSFHDRQRKHYWPDVVVILADRQDQSVPLLQHTPPDPGKTYYFLCDQFACKMPVENVKDLQALRQNVYF